MIQHLGRPNSVDELVEKTEAGVIPWELAINDSYLIEKNYVRFLYVSPCGIQYYVEGPYSNGFYRTQGYIWFNGEKMFSGASASKLHYAISDRYPQLSVFNSMTLLKHNDRWKEEPAFWTEFKKEVVASYLPDLYKTKKRMYCEYYAGRPLIDPNSGVSETTKVCEALKWIFQTNTSCFFYEELLSGMLDDQTSLHILTTDIGVGLQIICKSVQNEVSATIETFSLWVEHTFYIDSAHFFFKGYSRAHSTDLVEWHNRAILKKEPPKVKITEYSKDYANFAVVNYLCILFETAKQPKKQTSKYLHDDQYDSPYEKYSYEERCDYIYKKTGYDPLRRDAMYHAYLGGSFSPR